MKAGTTSLYQYLRAHPDIFMSSPKELHFFSARSGNDLEWYKAHFAAAGRAIAIGEASASYTTYPESEGVPERIAKTIPDARLIYLVRHPIERMRSHYLHRLGAGKEGSPIERALIDNPIYLRTSCYAERIAQYLQYYAEEQVLIVRAESLREERASTLPGILKFIGIDAASAPTLPEREYYQTSEKLVPRAFAQALGRRPLPRTLLRYAPGSVARWGRRLVLQPIERERGNISLDLRQRLEDLLRSDVRRLRAYVGEGFDGWGIA